MRFQNRYFLVSDKLQPHSEVFLNRFSEASCHVGTGKLYYIKSIHLVRFVYKTCGWEKKLTYRVPGKKYSPDDGLVYFDLRQAYEIHQGRMKEAEGV